MVLDDGEWKCRRRLRDGGVCWALVRVERVRERERVGGGGVVTRQVIE